MSPTVDVLRRMAAALDHRGPRRGGVAIATTGSRSLLPRARLSIIDVASGSAAARQRADHSLWVVFNGEIFNYVELREEPTRLGHVFRTKSDTEVIVHAFESWGEDAFDRFNGQWAVALWDATRKRLVLARDRFGVRPLQYNRTRRPPMVRERGKGVPGGRAAALEGVRLRWASMKPSPSGPPSHRGPPSPPSASSGRGTSCSSPTERWSSAPTGRCASRPRRTTKNSGATIGRAHAEAVHAEARASHAPASGGHDVPVGSYLSGGLDSSLVAALAIGQRKGRLATFSLRFEDAEYDETSYQRLMAARIESEHHEIVVTRRDIAEAVPAVVAHAERPLHRTAPAPLFVLSGLVQRHGIKVVLTGEGADEMFAGYDLFREAKVRRFWARAPASRFRPLLLERLYPYLARSPVAQRSMARQFFGRRLDEFRAGPAFLTSRDGTRLRR